MDRSAVANSHNLRLRNRRSLKRFLLRSQLTIQPRLYCNPTRSFQDPTWLGKTIWVEQTLHAWGLRRSWICREALAWPLSQQLGMLLSNSEYKNRVVDSKPQIKIICWWPTVAKDIHHPGLSHPLRWWSLKIQHKVQAPCSSPHLGELCNSQAADLVARSLSMRISKQLSKSTRSTCLSFQDLGPFSRMETVRFNAPFSPVQMRSIRRSETWLTTGRWSNLRMQAMSPTPHPTTNLKTCVHRPPNFQRAKSHIPILSLLPTQTWNNLKEVMKINLSNLA